MSENLRIHIVDPSKDEKYIEQISELLTQSTELFKATKGGHVPDELVTDVIHKHYTSIDSINNTLSDTGYRFALLDHDNVVGTILISKDIKNILVVDSLNKNVPVESFPKLFPSGYHNCINLAVDTEKRKNGFAKYLLNGVIKDYKDLFYGKGLSMRADPPTHDALIKIGFSHSMEYDEFLPPEVQMPQGYSSIKDFNNKFICSCKERPYMHYEIAKKQRYKYGMFIRNF